MGVGNRCPQRSAPLASSLVSTVSNFVVEWKSGDGYGRAVGVDGDHGEVGTVGVTACSRPDVLGVDANADFHRGAAGVVHRDREGDQFSDVDGLAKEDPVDGEGDDVCAGVPAGAGVGDLVEELSRCPPWTLPEKFATSGVIRTVIDKDVGPAVVVCASVTDLPLFSFDALRAVLGLADLPRCRSVRSPTTGGGGDHREAGQRRSDGQYRDPAYREQGL